MRQLLVCGVLVLSACATIQQRVQPAHVEMTSGAPATMAQETTANAAANAEEAPRSRAIAEAQERRLRELFDPILTQVERGGELPTQTLQVGFPPRTVTGVPVNEAQNWVRQTETNLQQRLGAPDVQSTELREAAGFVKRRVDDLVHESEMPVMEGGLVSRETIQRYANTFRSILSQAKTSSEYRVTFAVVTIPKGASFALCREYVPTDGTTVGTNVTLEDVFRGRYIYKITRKGYHDVQARLNLVNFVQSRLWCPLRADSDSADAVPCTPQ